MRYEGDAKIILKGNRVKASQLISRARSWLGVIFDSIPKGKSFRYKEEQLHGIIFSCFVNGFDVILEIFYPLEEKENIYFLFDPRSFQQPYQQGWGKPFYSSNGSRINYPYGSDLSTLASNVFSFKQAIMDKKGITSEFGIVPPTIPGNCLWLNDIETISVSFWGNTQGSWYTGSQPGGFGGPAFFRPHEIFIGINLITSPQEYYYYRMEYAKTPLPCGRTDTYAEGTFEDDWATSPMFDPNNTIWVNGKPKKVSVHTHTNGTLITGAAVIGNWLIYAEGGLQALYGVSDEYIHKYNLLTDKDYLMDSSHYDDPGDTDGNDVSWASNTSVINISGDGLVWTYLRWNFLDEVLSGDTNWEYWYFKIIFSLDDKGELSMIKTKEKSKPKTLDYYAFGMHQGEMYYYKQEKNNNYDYETYVIWFDIRWNSALGIQASWTNDADYLFVKVHGNLYRYKFGPDINNINFNNPEFVGNFKPDSLGALGGSGYDTNRINATTLAFSGGIIFSLSGVHLNPHEVNVYNSDKDYPQYNYRGYCMWIKPDGTAINLHTELLDEEFDLNNGRFSTIMLSIGEVGD